MRRLIVIILISALAGAAIHHAVAQGKKTPPLIPVEIPSPFPDGKATFDEAVDILKKNYYNPAFNDEIAWYAALRGVLRQLSPPNNKDLLLLWPPETNKVVQGNLKGVIGSIGIRFLFDPEAGVAVVSDVMPDTPAAKKELKLRDMIYAIDDKGLKNLAVNDVAAMIEKPVGTKVKLALRRGEELKEVTLKTEQIKVDDVRSDVVGDIGVIRIRFFSQNVPELFAKQFNALLDKKVKGIVIDLRNNGGGVFQTGLQLADQLLKKGSVVMYAVGREGQPQRFASGADGNVLTPVAVLVNGGTGSASEVLAAALQGNRRAEVVGERTMGKGSIEHIARLKNGYSMTFTVAAMYGPSGVAWQGMGLAPDKPVALAKADLDQANLETIPSARVARDKQLAAAIDILGGTVSK